MDGQNLGQTEDVLAADQADPWAAAFAALEHKDEEDAAATSDTGGDESGGPGAAAGVPDGGQVVPGDDAAGDGDEVEADLGGPGDLPGASAGEGGNAFDGLQDVDEDTVKRYEEDLGKRVRDQAITDIAAEFVKRGIRNQNGVLGATMDDPDVCKRDEDGVPHFYNPETGQEFRGDNPRRQAQEWVDDYNKELARVFNNACAQYEKHLMEASAPQLAVMKFKPKYDKLDDIRRGMFDNVIEDYEVRDDDGKLVGYSCDLDKALALVDKQIAMIQNYAKQHQQQQKEPPSGPALDMKTSSGAIDSGNQAPPKSLAEAMERLQDAQIAKMKR